MGECKACKGQGWIWSYRGGRIQIPCPMCKKTKTKSDFQKEIEKGGNKK